ncbi:MULTISPECIES: hypothetical protein [unclassified Nocardiopsis]|uniref:hypothetical protein n=1 Tax=unclassified Nocardiopsis TaxID=2649073 RepID=UPI00135995C9|nr:MULTISPECIES: hypothetical protein [unclassified Nocardiopsis]
MSPQPQQPPQYGPQPPRPEPGPAAPQGSAAPAAHPPRPPAPEPRPATAPARAWFGASGPRDTRPQGGPTREPREVGPPRPADAATVNPWGEPDAPNPDAEETDVFLILSADRRARKEKENRDKATEGSAEQEERSPSSGPVGPEAADASAPVGAAPAAPLVPNPPEAGSEAVEPDAPAAARAPEPPRGEDPVTAETGLPGGSPTAPDGDDAEGVGAWSVPAAPYASVENAPSDAGERPEGTPRMEGAPDQPRAPEGIESWLGAASHGHTPVPDGYEQRIAAVRPVPASPLRRAVFAATGGRLNLG